MNAHSSLGPRAIGGDPLEGSRWVRVLYLDESGVGSVEKDPYLCVAGVLIDADTQWISMANDLAAVLAHHTPQGVDRPPFIHAKDVFHGTKDFHRDTWPGSSRIGLLASVSALPVKYDIPVVWCAVDRRDYAKAHPNETPEEHKRDLYTVCVVSCLFQVEQYMRSLSDKSEVCSVVLEENKELQKRLPEIMDFIRNPDTDAGGSLEPGGEAVIPFRKIIDAPACQPKTASSILQMADYCAFAIKRRVQRARSGQDLVAPIASQFLLFKDADDLKSTVTMWNPKFMGWPKGIVEFDHSMGEFRIPSRMEKFGRKIGRVLRAVLGVNTSAKLSRWLIRRLTD